MNKAAGKIELEVQARESRGKNACRRIRARDMIPGNVYGMDRAPFMVAVDPKRIDELLRLGSGVNTIFTLRLAGQDSTREAMIKELQRDPVTERPVHVDFLRVDVTKKIQVNVPVRLIGTPEGVKNEGGLLDFVHREVEVECLTGNIPEHLEVEIGALHVNQHVSVRDLQRGEGVTVLDDPDKIIAVVGVKRAEEVAAPVGEVPAEGEAEPEVLKKPGEAAEAGPGEAPGKRED